MSAAPEPLPIEIAFLAAHGCSLIDLRCAAALAVLANAAPDRVMIKHGLIEEEAFYRALAFELGLAFTAAPRLGPGTDFPNSILSGLAPTLQPQGGIVIAPQGRDLRRILMTK